jgi:hypothetical protein
MSWLACSLVGLSWGIRDLSMAPAHPGNPIRRLQVATTASTRFRRGWKADVVCWWVVHKDLLQCLGGGLHAHNCNPVGQPHLLSICTRVEQCTRKLSVIINLALLLYFLMLRFLDRDSSSFGLTIPSSLLTICSYMRSSVSHHLSRSCTGRRFQFIACVGCSPSMQSMISPGSSNVSLQRHSLMRRRQATYSKSIGSSESLSEPSNTLLSNISSSTKSSLRGCSAKLHGFKAL